MTVGRAAVLGRPVAHSLSPVLHRAAYAALGLAWTYEAIDCGIADLETVLAERRDWAGFSATMPLKHALLDVAAEVSAQAAAIGAANTLYPGRDGWRADNTDGAGIAAALLEAGVAPASLDAVTILGAGGTAQAALAALPALGRDQADVLVRDPARARALLAAAERLGVRVRLAVLSAAAPELGAGLVISTLPPGAADPCALRAWASGQAVLDVAYVPWPSALAAAAARRGATVVSGALMLLHQAAAQVALMTGVDPADVPLAAMRSALAAAAPGCGV